MGEVDRERCGAREEARERDRKMGIRSGRGLRHCGNEEEEEMDRGDGDRAMRCVAAGREREERAVGLGL